MERWADCELYGGAASGVAVNLVRAKKLYQQSQQIGINYGFGVSMALESCIVAALHGDGAEAHRVFATLEADAPRDPRFRARASRNVAATDDRGSRAQGTDAAKGSEPIRRFLNEFKLNPAYTDISRRETLELRLFAAELLVAAELDNHDAAAHAQLEVFGPVAVGLRWPKGHAAVPAPLL